MVYLSHPFRYVALFISEGLPGTVHDDVPFDVRKGPFNTIPEAQT
jgi:hypothetical protein